MQPLNDDMDDLFKRAADEYPLNTAGADWNKVLQQLDHNKKDLPNAEQKKKDYKYLWLLLLLPIGFVCGRYVRNDKNYANAKANKEVSVTTAPNHKGIRPTEERVKSVSEASNSKRLVPGELAVNSKIEGSSNSTAIGGNGLVTTNNEPVLGKKASAPARRKPFASSAAVRNNDVRDNDTENLSNEAVNKSSSPQKAREGSTTSDVASGDTHKTTSVSNQPSLEKPGNTTTIVDSTIRRSSNADPIEKPISGNRIKNKNQEILKRGLTYSLLFGPDLSAVEFGRTTDLGYSLGLMLKYQFSKRFSLEAGALWDRKNYYSDGEYLDTSKLILPRHSIVKEATGYCTMVEIPVNVRYNFINKQNYSWFFAAGLSSYLMKDEDYNISYVRYNQQYDKDYGYMNVTRNWFSIMNVSIGYQTTLAKKTNVSIAPYIKLPLRGIGIANLPISSTGIYLAISRSVK